jgi:hypothetical protein
VVEIEHFHSKPAWPDAVTLQRQFVVGTGFPRQSPHADFGRQDYHAEGQLSVATAYSHCRCKEAS